MTVLCCLHTLYKVYRTTAKKAPHCNYKINFYVPSPIINFKIFYPVPSHFLFGGVCGPQFSWQYACFTRLPEKTSLPRETVNCSIIPIHLTNPLRLVEHIMCNSYIIREKIFLILDIFRNKTLRVHNFLCEMFMVEYVCFHTCSKSEK